ncbi:MAG: AI-2E family transporter [Phycisphaerales bacterium]|nr:AI-2E family transporter [Phycisphaerales bacterium]MCB9863132.1 AI-2E family transporter [Phycisphaerales bacterium]
MTGLFLIATFHTLYVGRSIFIPLVLAILLSLMLRPPVRFLSRRGIPDSVGAGLTLMVLSVVLVGGSYALSTPAATWINEIPKSVRTVERRLRTLEQPIKKVKEVSDAVENVAKVGDDKFKPEVKVKDDGLLAYLLGQTQGALMMLFLTAAFVFFLLASGDLFLRKLVHVIPKFRDKVQAVEIVHRIQDDIAAYIFSVTIINIGLGTSIGIAMTLLGVPNAALWAVMAFVLNFVPYLGAVAGVVVVGLVAFVQSDSIGYPLAVMAAYYALTTVEGSIITPMILGKRLRLNPVVVFLALIFWGWLWGIPGALLAVPILATFKILCDQLALLNTIGEFLGR